MRLLIAEDDRALGAFLRRGLETDGHQVTLVTDGQAAIETFVADVPDLTILDLNLPRKDGTEVLQFVRTVHDELPVLILTERSEIDTKIRCLDMGADDCMLKPFSLQELRARCRALIRRRREAGMVLRYGDLEVSRVDRSVKRAGESVQLTNKEFALLECLLLGRGRSISRADLLERVDESNSWHQRRRCLCELPAQEAEGHRRKSLDQNRAGTGIFHRRAGLKPNCNRERKIRMATLTSVMKREPIAPARTAVVKSSQMKFPAAPTRTH